MALSLEQPRWDNPGELKYASTLSPVSLPLTCLRLIFSLFLTIYIITLVQMQTFHLTLN